MAPDELTDLLVLMGADSTALRAYHVFGLLEKANAESRKSYIDQMFGLLEGVAGVMAYITLLQLPDDRNYVVLVSAAIIGVIGFGWWKGRHRNYEALEKVRRFGMYVDQMRRTARQLQIAQRLKGTAPELNSIKTAIRHSLRMAVQGIDALKDGLTPLDYFTLGEDRDVIGREFDEARNLLAA